MWLIVESFIAGFITLILGNIIFNLLINKSDKNKHKQNNTRKNINKSFFIIGVVLHILLENIGINKWYCNKKNSTKYHMLSTLI